MFHGLLKMRQQSNQISRKMSFSYHEISPDTTMNYHKHVRKRYTLRNALWMYEIFTWENQKTLLALLSSYVHNKHKHLARAIQQYSPLLVLPIDVNFLQFSLRSLKETVQFLKLKFRGKSQHSVKTFIIFIQVLYVFRLEINTQVFGRIQSV